MASATSTPTPPDAPLEEDDNVADLPLTMSASVVLDHLPKDAHKALETAGELEQAKGRLLCLPMSPERQRRGSRTASINRGGGIVVMSTGLIDSSNHPSFAFAEHASTLATALQVLQQPAV